MICMSVHGAQIERAPGTYALSIDRQPLDGALQQLAHQCGVQVIFFSRVTEGLSAPAIQGDYTLAAAMDRLLGGTGLTSRVINPQTVEVRPVQAKARDRSGSQTVASNAQNSPKEAAGPLEEIVVVGLAEQLVATRIATPLREIPQTISIVTGEQMRQRNQVDLADVLEHAPGVSTTRSTSLEQSFYSRGYEITSFHIDGGAAVNPKVQSNLLFLGTPDLIEFDHVEILRGSDALFSGNANPGGTISLVRKRPQRNFAVAFDGEAGSWDSGRVAMDITGPLAGDGALRGRGAAIYAHEGSFSDIDAHEKEKIFGALEYDLTPAATLTAGASYQWDDAADAADGLPFYADGRDSRLPRNTATQFDWARYRNELRGMYLQYRQQVTPDWAVKFNASGWRTEAEFAFGSLGVSTFLDRVTGEVDQAPSATFSARPNIHTQNTVDVTVTGTLNWWGWREELAIGADYLRLKVRSDNEAYVSIGAPLGDLRTFNPAAYPDPRLEGPPAFGLATASSLDQYGMFASLRVYFGEQWSMIGGARLSSDHADTHFTVRVPPSFQDELSTSVDTDDVVTPYAGLMYALDSHYSLYASYADIYRALNAMAEQAPGKRLGPMRGVNIEAGIKGEWRNGALNGSLAVYHIEQSNNARQVSGEPDLDPSTNCCFAGPSSNSRGVDVDLHGELTPAWSISAGYSYNENESPEGDALSRFTPKHLLQLWTNVRLPGELRRWEIGAGLTAQSETTTRFGPFQICPLPPSPCAVVGVQPGYAVLDLRAGFDIDRTWRVALSVNNVLDKRYYESIDTPPLHAWYGEPRNWILRVDASY